VYINDDSEQKKKQARIRERLTAWKKKVKPELSNLFFKDDEPTKAKLGFLEDALQDKKDFVFAPEPDIKQEESSDDDLLDDEEKFALKREKDERERQERMEELEKQSVEEEGQENGEGEEGMAVIKTEVKIKVEEGIKVEETATNEMNEVKVEILPEKMEIEIKQENGLIEQYLEEGLEERVEERPDERVEERLEERIEERVEEKLEERKEKKEKSYKKIKIY